MTLLTNVFDGQSLFRSVEALAGSDALLSSTHIAPSLAELELANLPPLPLDDATAQSMAKDGTATAITGAVTAVAGTVEGATATVAPAAQAVSGGALAAASAAASVDGGALPLDADVAAAALLGPDSAAAVASAATLGSGSSALDVAAAGALGAGTLSSGVPILGNLLGGTDEATSPVGHLPLVGDLLAGTGHGNGGLDLGGLTQGLPETGGLLGHGLSGGLLDNGVPVVGNLLESLGNGIAQSNGPGEGPLVAEVLNLPLELLGLNDSTGNLEGALHDTGVVVAGAGTLVDALGENVGNALSQPLATTANDAVADVHAFLEVVSHEVALNSAIHAVTDLGNTVGLGEIGGDNLVTDLLEIPGVVAGGGDLGAQLGDINTDVGNILTGIPPIATGAVLDLGDSTYGIDLTGQNGIVADLTGALSGTSVGSPSVIDGLGDSLAFPSLGGAGADALVGTLGDSVHSVVLVAEQPLASLDLGLGDILGAPTDHHVPDATGQDHHGSFGLGLI